MARADTSETFFLSPPTAYYTAETTVVIDGKIRGFRKPSVTDNYTKAQIENARVYFVAVPNSNAEVDVASFDPPTDTINLAGTPPHR